MTWTLSAVGVLLCVAHLLSAQLLFHGGDGFTLDSCPFKAIIEPLRVYEEDEGPPHKGAAETTFFGLHPLRRAALSHFEVSVGPCAPSQYRSIDGSCNNLRNPQWGATMTPHARLLPAKYSDGVEEPAVSVTGQDLPNPRQLSYVLFPTANVTDPKLTLAVMQYGQIISHDMTSALANNLLKIYPTNCCTPGGKSALPRHIRRPDCFPISVPKDDPVYGSIGITCLHFIRSRSDVSLGYKKGKPADQLVGITAYLDASLVYGSDKKTADSLRQYQGGLLKVEYIGNRPFLPAASNASTICDIVDFREPCYTAGDDRVNQNPQLTIIHTILHREHNRIASYLEEINPHWDDERLYQEARRILIAEHQHISYYELLPVVLGQHTLRKHRLLYDTHGYTNDYNEDVNPSIINGYSTAAFRVFHSNIAGFLHLIGEHRSSFGALRLSDHFDKPEVIERGDNFDRLIRGMTTQPQSKSDQFFTSEISGSLFRYGQPVGQDLRAIDIQRGRDHGLPSYNDYRSYCGFPKATSFNDFLDFISLQNVQKLSQLYAHPDDVDFVVGGSLELLTGDALVGPTYLCVIVEQFFRTRVGDRFFYENGVDLHSAFNLDQLAEIRNSSIARLFCDNGDQIYSMQPQAFRQISPGNEVVPCDRYDVIPAVNLDLWKEEISYHKK